MKKKSVYNTNSYLYILYFSIMYTAWVGKHWWVGEKERVREGGDQRMQALYFFFTHREEKKKGLGYEKSKWDSPRMHHVHREREKKKWRRKKSRCIFARNRIVICTYINITFFFLFNRFWFKIFSKDISALKFRSFVCHTP